MGDEPIPMKPAIPEQAVFAEALQRATPEARATYLNQACGTDAALRRRVELLLRAFESAGNFLEQPPTGLASAEGLMSVATEPSEKPGDRIGRYKLLEQIGEGGCGEVYMAEQEEPVRRRVALKVIKLGMDTKQVIARFEAERQALALMDHPNIAKVLDAGATETGRPFFVMELVRGIRITDYCDQNNLPTAERLELFIQVCQAIQHAHQKGIIHRDIKPSNILVTQHDNVAVPKVIDFGIAKATTGQLTDKTLFTAFAQFIGTPAYMSPEQAQMSGLDIDTRADIYSLGVLLYELLTGNTPFNAKDLLAAGLDEMRRKIREDEPARPSTCLSTMAAIDLTTVAKNRSAESPKLIHLVHGDLDWLVMKCLEKDRTRRYETANALAMDLQRHLNNEPVVACPPSNLYRFQKLVRRNKLTFAAVGAVATALIFGLGLSTWLFLRERIAVKVAAESALRAEANEKKATAAAAKSQQVAQFLKSMLEGVQPAVAMGRDTTMLREVLDKTSERIDKDLKDQPDVEAELRNTIGEVYVVLGQYPSAETNHQKALAIRRKLLGNEHPDVATSLHNLAYLLREQGRPGADVLALPLYSEALAIRRKVFGNESLEVAKTLDHMGGALRGQRKLEESESMYREALAIRKKLLGDEHPDIARSLDGLSLTLEMQNKLVEGESLSRQALAMRIKVSGMDNPQVATCMDHLANFSIRNGNLAEAETLRREALALRRKILGNEHPILVLSLNRLAAVLTIQNKKAEAESLYGEALAMRRRLHGNGHGEVAESLKRLADLLFEQRKLTEAEELYRERLKNLRGRVTADDVKNAAGLDPVAKTLLAQGKFAEAELLARESLAIRQKNNSPEIIDSLNLLVDVLRAGGKLAEAENLRREQLSEAENLGRKELAQRKKQFGEVHREVGNALGTLAEVLEKQGRWDAAEAVWREELSVEKKLSGDEHPWVANSLDRLGSLFNNSGKTSEAEVVLRESLAIRRKLPNDMELASALARLTSTLLAAQKFADAESSARECLAIREKKFPDDWLTFNARGMLGGSLLGQKKYAEAEPILLASYEGIKQREGKIPVNQQTNGKLRLKEAVERLAQFYQVTGQSDKAAEWESKLAEFDAAKNKEASQP